MMPMNNPMVQLVAAMQAGRNPNIILQQMARSNPQVRQMMQMINGKTPDQLRKMAQNMAAERGTTVEDIAKQLGIGFPSNR